MEFCLFLLDWSFIPIALFACFRLWQTFDLSKARGAAFLLIAALCGSFVRILQQTNDLEGSRWQFFFWIFFALGVDSYARTMKTYIHPVIPSRWNIIKGWCSRFKKK
jgi:hypothetical protein